MYLITRGVTGFPDNTEALQNHIWYNIWPTKQSPYNCLQHGNIVILRSDENQRCYFKARINNLLKINFCNRNQLSNALHGFGYFPYNNDAYFELAAHIKEGYLLAYSFTKVKPLQPNTNFNVPRVNRNGWLNINNNTEAMNFFNLNQ
jgi:hypothetical protein